MTADTAPKKPGVFSRMSRAQIAWTVGIVVFALLVVGVAFALWATAQPTYFLRYTGWQRNVTMLGTSAHKGMACDQCHAGANGFGYRVTLVADFYSGLVSNDKQYAPTFGLPRPTREQCLKCHAYDWSYQATRTGRVPHPAHLRVIDEQRDCIDCHRWVGHEENIQTQHQKMPFSIVCASFGCHVGWKQPNQCANCHHQLQQSLSTWRAVHPKVVFAQSANGCLEKCHTADQCRTCHTTGRTPVFPGVINASTVSDIERAHVKSDWLTQHGGFAMQDASRCLTCHVTFQECEDCHAKRPAFHGSDNMSWVGTRHEAIAKVNPKRCFACHKATECNYCHDSFKRDNPTMAVPSFPDNAGAYMQPSRTATQSQNATQ